MSDVLLFFRFVFDVVFSVDDMGTRIDELEKSIGDLMAQAGIENEEHK